MKNSKLILEINQILERIDKKIEEVQADPGKLTPVKQKENQNHRNNSKPHVNRSSSASSLKSSGRATPVQPKCGRSPSFQPYLCKNSLRIAKKLENSSKRLTVTPDKKQGTPSFEFKPEINNRSKKIISNQPKTMKKHWQSLYELGMIQKIKAENKKKIAQAEESNKEYPFKPVTNNNKKVSDGLIERNYNWLRNKIEKLNIKTEAEQFRGLEECTFAPKINENKTSKTESDTLEDINGVQNFLHRQYSARKDLIEENYQEKKESKDITLNEYMKAVNNLQEYLYSINIQ